ncbi:MAG: hypoxanthine phosphoribosyltransferase [Kiritimatiellia bacterium]
MPSTPAEQLAPLISADDLQARISELAREIALAFAAQTPVLVGLLKGSFMFMADLARALHRQGMAPTVDFMIVASYGAGTQTSGSVQLLSDIETEIRGRPVLLVDDILDSGHTLDFCLRRLRRDRPAQLRTCILLDKPARRVIACPTDHVGFTVPNEFIVGYGLDYQGRYRELPGLAVLNISADTPTGRKTNILI